MKYTSSLYHYSRLSLYNSKKYDKIFLETHISSDEIALKDPDTDEHNYYFPLKKNKVNYLLPTDWKADLPLKVTESVKIPFRNKGYHLIVGIKSVSFSSEKTMTYKEYINNFLPYNHENPNEWTVWKIITDVAYRNRINIRAISYPGWGKDSPLMVLSLIRMDVATADKPSYPKLKYMICAKNKVIGLNEIQALDSEEKKNISKFYETVGAFEPTLVFDKRATGGTSESAELENLSSMTFYNFPKSENERIFDDPEVFHPKVMSRIFPLLLTGGTHKVTAMKESFSENVRDITKDEINDINIFTKNNKYWEDNGASELSDVKKTWKLNRKFNNNRWERNYVTICDGLKLYSDTEEEFHKWETVLLNMHNNYQDFVEQFLEKQSMNEEVQSALIEPSDKKGDSKK